MLKKVLIANRGEIAVRVIRACREMDIGTVAIYSEPDRTSLHVQLADEAYCVGPAPSTNSYLNSKRIVSIARKCRAEAVHPGYGFLAENSEFARQVESAGIKFVGPDPDSIRLMGDKTRARVLARQLGVPTIPGTTKPVSSLAQLTKAAQQIGFPVLMKAAAGGGGKGMRKVAAEEGLADAFRASRNEARSAFGDERVYLEKYLVEPRHIEFQILADHHGNTVHLFERECSIQRRHQKLLEESPSVVMTPELRKKMGDAALKLAEAAKYENAGTIEFLVDNNRGFYFLEMNTRLQVEHPVTEAVTGIDIVKQQLRIASGEKLDFKQDDLSLNGHAIECRIYAEDPATGFMPSTGEIRYLFEPDGIGVRCDSGIHLGAKVYPYYDPMLSKVIVWADSRENAIARMKRALQEYQIHGLENTIPFFIELLDHEKFRKGELTTDMLDRETISGLIPCEEPYTFAGAVSSVLRRVEDNSKPARGRETANGRPSQWQLLGRKESLK